MRTGLLFYNIYNVGDSLRRQHKLIECENTFELTFSRVILTYIRNLNYTLGLKVNLVYALLH